MTPGLCRRANPRMWHQERRVDPLRAQINAIGKRLDHTPFGAMVWEDLIHSLRSIGRNLTLADIDEMNAAAAGEGDETRKREASCRSDDGRTWGEWVPGIRTSDAKGEPK